jgi:ribA/ribD-fused uncharacterized protein
MLTLTPPIDRFRGEHEFLSNFYLFTSEEQMTYNGFPVHSAEQAFQLAKATTLEDMIYVGSAPTPREAKHRGRTIVLRPGWHPDIALSVMWEVLTLKFVNSGLRQQLVATSPRCLIEGNTWHDHFWGADITTWSGSNCLGLMLMDMRHLCGGADRCCMVKNCSADGSWIWPGIAPRIGKSALLLCPEHVARIEEVE